ncbi:MAG: hypothetical protein FVQ81_01810 [Candidatus Glassbacteria bacterium]|nr:hypothetical protein [Candidatus Glassbacteria bacterium]
MSDAKDIQNVRGKKKFSPASVLEQLGLYRRTGKLVIGIQLAGDIFRIVEIDRSGSTPRIMNFSAIDPLMDDTAEAADQVVGLMCEKEMTARIAHATVYDQGTELRQINLPVLAKNEMNGLVRRELKKIVPDASPGDVAFDYWYERSVKKGRKTDVLVGVIYRESSQRIIKLMEHCGLDTELITTVPMSLIASMGLMGEKYAGAITAAVHLERDRSYLVIANKGMWVFSREFQTVLNKEEQQQEQSQPLTAKRKFASARYMADQDKLLTEVNRSLLYFKQRFRGEGVTSAVLSGEAFNLEEMAEAFEQNLGIEGVIFSPMEAFDTTHMGDRAAKLGRIFPSLCLPVGAAMQSLRDGKLNFVPEAYINRYRERAQKVITIAAAVILLIVLSVGYLMIRGSRVELEELLAQNNEEKVIAEMTAKLDDIAVVTTQRNLAEKRRAFLAGFELGQGSTDELLIALSHILPPEITLQRLAVKGDTVRVAEIYGQVDGLGIADSDSTFNTFYGKLTASGLFLEVAEPEISSSNEGGRYVLRFKVNCELPS